MSKKTNEEVTKKAKSLFNVGVKTFLIAMGVCKAVNDKKKFDDEFKAFMSNIVEIKEVIAPDKNGKMTNWGYCVVTLSSDVYKIKGLFRKGFFTENAKALDLEILKGKKGYAAYLKTLEPKNENK